jgi:glutaredoxin-like protein
MACLTWPARHAALQLAAVLADNQYSAPRWGAEQEKNVSERLLNDQIVKQIKDAFDKQLKSPVQVLFFGQEDGCDYCSDTLQLVEEVVAVSDKLSLQVYDLETDSALAQTYNVDKAPGLVIAAKEGDEIHDYGIRFAGIPSGYEFSSLIQSLVLVSQGDSGLEKKTRQALAALKDPVHLLVFTTPT